MDLKAKLLNPAQTVMLYGTTPPRLGTPEAVVESAVTKLAERLQPLSLDGVVVYDIQDESSRNPVSRPFPFIGTIDPRLYSRLLTKQLGIPTITYKCVGSLDATQWSSWLGDTADNYGIRFISVVGRPTSGNGHALALADAVKAAASHRAQFLLGGVVIAERHSSERSESARMLAKGLQGCSYFVSQTVYHADATRLLLKDYRRDCAGAGTMPHRIVFTFSPIGRQKTLAFIKWLGVRVPQAVERSILEAANPLSASINICRDNLRRILDDGHHQHIPIGVNVESVSINKEEIDASIDLFHALADIVREYMPYTAVTDPHTTI